MAALIGVTTQPKAGGGSDYICKVPLDLLSEDGVPPAEGDSVSYSVDGTVQSVSGAIADVKIDAVNGEPVSEEAGKLPAFLTKLKHLRLRVHRQRCAPA